MRVNFVLDRPALDRLRGLDPDRDHEEFQQGDEAWILQTFLRLERAGFETELTARPVAGDAGIVIFHAKDKRALAPYLGALAGSLLVAVRGDLRGSLSFADVEIVQRPGATRLPRHVFLPHWPQPGLRPRDPRRGQRLERLAYKGYLANLHPDFRDPSWARWLADHGIDWSCDAIEFAGAQTQRETLAWPDYREVDAVLAVRPPGDAGGHKPATKLYNAWLAGTPAFLGPELPFRETRRDPLDYLEVTTRDEAQQAILALRADARRFAAMVEHGKRRGAEFTVERTLERWRILLAETLPALAAQRLSTAPASRRAARRLRLQAQSWLLALPRRTRRQRSSAR